MDFKPEFPNARTKQTIEFAEAFDRKPLQLLRDKEAMLRDQTVETLVPILPESLGNKLQAASFIAEDLLNYLVEVDLNAISDQELQPARILIGLSFIGFGALAIALLILYLYTLHPKLNQIQQIHHYWHQYVWFVSLGVTGMLMLGREVMRPKQPMHINRNKSRIN